METNKVYIENYGCQMNFADTEIELGILQNYGYSITKELDNADVVLLNTCSIKRMLNREFTADLEILKLQKKIIPTL